MKSVTIAIGLALVLGHAPSANAQFPAELRGQVTDAQTHAPLAGARIEAIGTDQILTTDADGGFILRGLHTGRREIQATAIGYRPARATVELEDGVSSTITLELTPTAVRLAELRAQANNAADPSVTVIDRATIARTKPRDLGDLLAAEAGLTVTRRGGPGAPATLSIRGSTANQVLVLVDGVPLNDPVSGDADLSSVRPELVERVVVLRGAQAARYGARALAGAVVVETRRPTAELMLGADAAAWGERGAHASAGWRHAGAATSSALLSVGYTRTAGDFPFTVPDVRGGGEANRLNGDSKRLDVLGSAGLERGAWSLRARGEGHDLDRGMPGSVAQPSVAARQDGSRLGGGVQIARTGARSEQRLDIAVQRQRNRYFDPDPPQGGAYDDSLWARDVIVGLSSSTRLGALTTAAGGEFRQLELRATTLENGPATQRFLGGWLQSRLGLESSIGRWELAATARADRDDLAGRTYLSPKIGATLSRRRTALHLSWGQAFSPATLADQFFQAGILARPNPNLTAERVRGELEGGVAVDDLSLLGARVGAGISAFRADVDGMILWFPDFRFVWSPNNYDVRRAGFEITGTARLPNHAVELTGSLSHVAATYVGPVLSGQVAYRPRLAAATSLRASLASIDILTRYRYTGTRRTVPASELNTLPPFGVLDLQLSRPFAIGRWTTELTAAVENLLDQNAAMLIDYPLPGRTWRLGVQLTRGE